MAILPGGERGSAHAKMAWGPEPGSHTCCGGVSDWTAGQVRVATELRRFEDKMNEVQRHCGFCWVIYGPAETEHLAVEYTRTGALNIERSEWLREGIRLDRRCRDCWKCGISQQTCKGVENGRACQRTGIAGVLCSVGSISQGQSSAR
jgi:hypothetical protein